jgi:hypothetical protein
MTVADLKVSLVPWDDPEFVRAFERAHAQVVEEGLTINGPAAAGRTEELLHAGGYPNARIDCERSPEEALRHAARWTVRRDGAVAAATG